MMKTMHSVMVLLEDVRVSCSIRPCTSFNSSASSLLSALRSFDITHQQYHRSAQFNPHYEESTSYSTTQDVGEAGNARSPRGA